MQIRLDYLLPRSLFARLAPAFSLLAAALALALAMLVEQRVIAEVERGIGGALADLAAQTSDKLERGMFERYREVALIAASAAPFDPATDAPRLKSALARVQRSYAYYEWIGIVARDGKVLASSNDLLVGADVSARQWFRAGLRDGFVGDVHEALLLAKLLPPVPSSEPRRFVDFAFPVADAQGRISAVLGAHLSWDWAREVERSVVGSAARRSPVETIILDRNGRVLLGPSGLVGTILRQGSLRRAATDPAAGFVRERWADGRDYVVGYNQGGGYANYRGLGWIVMVRQDVGSAYAPVGAMRRQLLWGGCALGLLAALLGVGLARILAAPLERLAAGAAAPGGVAPGAAAGDHAELHVLRAALAGLAADLEAHRAGVRQHGATLEQLVEARTHELRGALEIVRASEARIRAIVDAAQDAFIAVDLDGRVKEWNRQAEALLGWRRDEAIGHDLSELMLPERFRPDDPGAVAAFLESGRDGPLGARVERLVLDRHGLEFPVEMSTSLTGAGPGATFSIFLRDITERKRIDSMKNEFVGTVSHELRTPLTAIRASLALLADGALGPLSPDVQEMIEICNSNCLRLNRLVDDMLDIQKIEAGMMAFAPRTQPLLPLVQEAIRTMRAMATARQVDLVLEAGADDAALAATFDFDRMMQVLTNLLSNAIKAAPPASAVTLALAPSAGGASLSVSDRGPGIALDQRERVFKPFVQIGPQAGAAGGTGLGLAICKRIVEEHGGSIAIGDAPAGGAVFQVTLPRAPG